MKGSEFMLEEITKISPPNWLMSNEFTFDSKEVLDGSLFYPCSGFDANPIRIFHGNVYSFVYADYGLTETQFIEYLSSRPFSGYEIIHKQSIPMSWGALLFEERLMEMSFENKYLPYKIEMMKNRVAIENIKPFFCEWIIFKNDEGKRFSLLYICLEALTVYIALYKLNKFAPRIITIINPGTGFGLNWTDFESEDGFFGKEVLESLNATTEYIVHSKEPWVTFPNRIYQITNYDFLWGR
jgi:hypothetical protein